MNTTVTCNLGFFKERTTATLKEPQCFFTNTGLCSGRFQPVCLLSLRLVCISRLGLLIQTSTWVLSCLFLWGEERQAVWRGGDQRQTPGPSQSSQTGASICKLWIHNWKKDILHKPRVKLDLLIFPIVAGCIPLTFWYSCFIVHESINMTRAGKVNQKLHRLFMTYMQNK